MNGSVRRVVVGLIVAGAMSATARLHAADAIMPGTACRFYGTQASDAMFNPSGYGANGLKNTSANKAYYITCPIPKVRRAKTRGAWISITDDKTECRLYKRSNDGQSSSYVAPKSITGPVNGAYSYNWDFGTAGWDTSNHSSAIYCRVDPLTVINSYYHQEL